MHARPQQTWIDTHAHISCETPSLLADLDAVFEADPADLRMVISPGSGLLQSMQADPSAARAAADIIHRLVRARPGRFYGACCVNLNFLDDSLRLLDRCLGEYGFVMVGEMLGYIFHFDMATPAGERVARKALEYGVPIQIHLSTSNSPHQGHTSGMGELEDILAISEGVPEARYILAHMIGMPDDDPPVVRAYLDRIEERCGGWPENFWAEIIDFHSPGVAEALARIPHDRLLAGTDWCTRIGPPYLPYGVDHRVWSGGEPGDYEPSVARLCRFLADWGASPEDIQRIAWQNAAELLGLEIASPA